MVNHGEDTPPIPDAGYIIGTILWSLLALTVLTLYLVEKIGEHDSSLRLPIILVAITLQILQVLIVLRARKKRKFVLLPRIGSVIGYGRYPLSVILSALIFVLVIALGFEVSYLQGVELLRYANHIPLPTSTIVRYVEIDLYWTLLNFLGNSDNELVAIGFGRFLTVLSSLLGVLLLGIFISVLINRTQEIRATSRNGLRSQEDTLASQITEPPKQSRQHVLVISLCMMSCVILLLIRERIGRS